MYREQAGWGAWTQRADLLPVRYADNLRAAGALVVLLPPGAGDAAADAGEMLDGLDGLVLTGGADVDPARYGADRLDTTDLPRTDRDDWEIALALAAVDRDKPVLGICRGLQVLNVALGGTLIQHLPDVLGHDDHRGSVGEFPLHLVKIDPQSVLAAAVGDALEVPTHHHQAIDAVAAPLAVTAWSSDGVVEAVTCPGRAWVNGVQWHPEVDGEQPLFRAFVAACR